MTRGTWKTETDGLQITVKVEGTEISVLDAMVCFAHGELLGEACNRFVPVTDLGSTGERIVQKLRGLEGWTRIRISKHYLVVQARTRIDFLRVLRAVRDLMKSLVGPSSLRGRVYRIPAVRDTKVGRQPSPTRYREFGALGATS